MCIKKSIAEIIVIALLAGCAGSALAKQRSVRVSGKPVAAAVSKVNPSMAVSNQLQNDRDFIDTGVLEGTDVLEGDLEIGGLLVDDTISRIGHDLFDAFNRSWKPIEGARYNIAFGEKIDPIRGSLLSVQLNETVIFEGFMTPRQDAINDLGKGLAKDIRTLVKNTTTLEEEEFY
jgi:hypothetical protein